ncbi:hypothetical protein OROHE_005073 [Orobanche hederae]
MGCLILSVVILFRLSSSSSCASIVSFDQGFSPLYGERNMIRYDDEGVQISMDETTSSGFRSKLSYVHGRFETSLKLPERNYTAGVVVTFYGSNDEKYPSYHDEIDFEFLGHIDGQNWLLQTNFYGNGSTNRGREERYELWFDPSEDFHRYGVLWTDSRLTYYVDDVPIRHVDAVGADFPSKEMIWYGTIWNGSDWATAGGKYKLDMNYGPFIAKYSNFVLDGCPFNIETSSLSSTPCNNLAAGDTDMITTMGPEERARMHVFRRKLMTYSYCYDKKRYAMPFPECVFDSMELQHLQTFDPWTFGSTK